MILQQRIDYLTYVFGLLESTNSRLEKESIVNDIEKEYKEDFDYIIECLAGKHKFGYKYYKTTPVINDKVLNLTVKQALDFLRIPMLSGDLSHNHIQLFVEMTNQWYDFFEPIVNRTLRLGIGNSLIDKDSLSPMLAKKFDGYAKFDKDGYYLTEKLDGNRCIAHFEDGKWQFTSRSGKQMHVDFDMSGLDERLIYDGEILSPEQVSMSLAIEDKIRFGIEPNTVFSDNFSSTSGLINQHRTNKNLVYNIFDVMYNVSYRQRREELDRMHPESNQVRILPVLKHCKDQEELQEAWDILNKITDLGGEGVMINLGASEYLHKRTDQILKLKKVYTMDMIVYDIKPGTGKYENQVGSIEAKITTEDGKEIYCSVGTGLSDSQRMTWSLHPDKILGKTIEVSYFSLSQNKQDKGSNVYSLRFPRLKRVRSDKSQSSEF
jgi:ATP-dependent DNA ligase